MAKTSSLKRRFAPQKSLKIPALVFLKHEELDQKFAKNNTIFRTIQYSEREKKQLIKLGYFG